MNDNAFNFQTLHPDTIMDALFEQGIRWIPGLPRLTAMKTVSINSVTKTVDALSLSFIALNVGLSIRSGEEHQFALELVSDEVPVAAPLVLNGQTLLSHQGFHYAIFPSVGGRQFEADNIDQMEAVGRYLGRMHQTGCMRTFAFRPTIGLEEYWLSRVKFLNTHSLSHQGKKRLS